MLISKIYCCTCSNALFLFTTQASGLHLTALFWDFARHGHYNALGILPIKIVSSDSNQMPSGPPDSKQKV